MPLRMCLREVPPVRTEVERDLFAVVEQAVRVRHGQMLDPRASRGLRADVSREQGRLVAVVGIVGIEVLGHEESPGALGEREAVDQRVVLRARGARRAGAPARGRARSRAPTTGRPRAATTRGSSRPRACTSPSAGADGPTTAPSSGRGRPCSRARRRARVATSIRAGSMRRRMRSASSSAASCASASDIQLGNDTRNRSPTSAASMCLRRRVPRTSSISMALPALCGSAASRPLPCSRPYLYRFRALLLRATCRDRGTRTSREILLARARIPEGISS